MPGREALARGWRTLAWQLVHRAWRAAQQAGAITAATPAGRRFAAFGPGSIMAFPTGGLVPGHQLGEHPVLRVGNGCVIGRGSHIIAHHSIVIGDDVFTGPYVYITDQNHGYTDPDVPIGRQWPSNTAVSIGPGTWLGAGVIVLPGAQIGRNVVVAAGSVVRGMVPDRCVIAGVPAKVVREYVAGDGWSRPSPTVGDRT
jgi:acetyltransferase-like isoleucine patch superfamily enzyme